MPKHEPKYELTDQTIVFRKRKLFRIRALRDLDTPWAIVKVGELGGFVGSEDNLSHEGVCWISDEAKVFEDARVGGQADVSGHAEVGGHASVGGKALIICSSYSDVIVGGDATIEGTARIGPFEGRSIHITTGRFTSGYFFDQDDVDAYLASLETKEQAHAQA